MNENDNKRALNAFYDLQGAVLLPAPRKPKKARIKKTAKTTTNRKKRI